MTAEVYVRVRALKRLEYARLAIPTGAVVVVDADTARRWRDAGLAEAAPVPPLGPQIFPTCPKCRGTFPIPATLEPGTKPWVQCPTVGCQGGWLR
jgi:hypothetical protein